MVDECELSWYVGRGSLVCRALFVELLALNQLIGGAGGAVTTGCGSKASAS